MKLPRPTWITFAFAVAAALMGEVRSGPGWKTALLLVLAALSMKWPGRGGLGKGEEE